METESVRLNKYLASTGICSRRMADEMIACGRVLVNGKVPGAGDRVSLADEISVDGKILAKAEAEKVVLAYYKPEGIVCSSKDQSGQGKDIISAVNYTERLHYIGRLDMDSEGLVLLTNDGRLTDFVARARNHHEKEYEVVLDKNISDDDIKRLSQGVDITLKDQSVYHTRNCRISRIDAKSISIILTEGKNRQIRRMCEAVGYTVVQLKRVRVMNVTLGNLKKGQYRILSSSEIAGLWEQA